MERVVRRRALRLAFAASCAAALATGALASTAAAASSVPLSAQVAIDWNSNAVDAVRAAKTIDGVPAGGASRTMFQVEGTIYMAYVQAAVYDAVTKIEHRYRPYHHFEAAARLSP